MSSISLIGAKVIRNGNNMIDIAALKKNKMMRTIFLNMTYIKNNIGSSINMPPCVFIIEEKYNGIKLIRVDMWIKLYEEFHELNNATRNT